MGYDYYCSHCGKQLSQNTVLFDMQYLLTRDKTQPFNILKYRMTMAELQKFLAAGTGGDHGFKTCRLTMADIMSIVSNKNNLDDASVAGLTLADIKAYIDADLKAQAKKQAAADDYDDYGDIFEEEAETAKEEESSYEKPAAIVTLENKTKALVDEVFIKDLVTKDLSILQNLFLDGDVFEIEVCPQNDIDNEGNPVLEGYSFKSRGIALSIKARVCDNPECGKKIFDHAGTAKHQSIVFIGSPKAGKTSTLLALSHYAMDYMSLGFGNQIWEGCQVIDAVKTIELVDTVDRFSKDTDNYRKGIAPEKTKAEKREDAYSVTFRVSNELNPDKKYLITFQDLPGELCELNEEERIRRGLEKGEIDSGKVRTLFPVALTCDAFVLCFDTQTLRSGQEGVVTLVNKVCKWADQFQAMRAQHNGLDTYVPTMVLFTKCEDLEDPDAVVPPLRVMMPLERTYMLKLEKQQIRENRVYNYFCNTFEYYGQLKEAYHAMMRCSPFGYNAPSEEYIAEAQKRGEELEYHPPMPKNIDALMRWLLSVTGCIPTEASFSVGAVGGTPFTLNKFCLNRPQLRKENPGWNDDKNNIVNESLARCALFENPGYFDRQFVLHHGDGKFVLGPIMLRRKMKPNTNEAVKEK